MFCCWWSTCFWKGLVPSSPVDRKCFFWEI